MRPKPRLTDLELETSLSNCLGIPTTVFYKYWCVATSPEILTKHQVYGFVSNLFLFLFEIPYKLLYRYSWYLQSLLNFFLHAGISVM